MGRGSPTHQDAYAAYSRALASGNYPGSSGYWGGPHDGPGAPGDDAREWLRKYYLGGATVNPAQFGGANAGGPPDFTVTKTPKDPALTEALAAVTARSQSNAADVANQFQAYLKEALASQTSQKAQLEADKAALDTSGISAQLPAINRSYEAGQNQITSEIARRNQEKSAQDAAAAASVEKRNTDFAAETAATIARLNAANEATLASGRRVGEQAIAAGRTYNNSFDAVGNAAGGPNAMSGARTNREMALVDRIMRPIELARDERAYNQIGQYERPWQERIYGNDQAALGLRRGMASEAYGNDQALLGRRSALESDFAARGTDTARYLYELKARTAGRANELESQYLDSLLRKAQAGQQMTAADIANVRQLSAAYQDANWYTVNTPLDREKLLNPIGFTPGYPDRNYRPQGPQPSPNYGPPISAGGGGDLGVYPPNLDPSQNPMWDPASRRYIPTRPIDPRTGLPVNVPAAGQYGWWNQSTPRSAANPYGGGFTVGPEGVTGLGSFENFDWSRAYERGRTPAEQAYYDAIAAASQ